MSVGGMHLSDIKKCPECGKEFSVLHPDLWTYRAPKFGNSRYYCSYTCYRAYELKGEKKTMGKAKLTEDQKKHAVEIAAGGGDPRPYLRECGSQNPEAMWSVIRAWAKDTLPDLAAKMPKTLRWIKTVETPEGEYTTAAGAMAGMKDAADKFFAACEDMGLKIDVPETPADVPKIRKPVNYDGMTVREVEGDFGRYRRSDVNEKTYIDFEPVEGCDVMSYTIDQWRNFRKEHERAAAILGVEL